MIRLSSGKEHWMTQFCLWSLVSSAVYFDKGVEFNGPSHAREEQRKQTRRSKHTERTANIVGKKEEAEHAPLLGNGPVHERRESQQSKGFSWRAENHIGGWPQERIPTKAVSVLLEWDQRRWCVGHELTSSQPLRLPASSSPILASLRKHSASVTNA